MREHPTLGVITQIDRIGLASEHPGNSQPQHRAARYIPISQRRAGQQSRTLFATLLEVDPGAVGDDDDFFELGGDSLLVIKLVARIRRTPSCEISPGDVFDHPTVAKPGPLPGRRLTELIDESARQTRTIAREISHKKSVLDILY